MNRKETAHAITDILCESGDKIAYLQVENDKLKSRIAELERLLVGIRELLDTRGNKKLEAGYVTSLVRRK